MWLKALVVVAIISSAALMQVGKSGSPDGCSKSWLVMHWGATVGALAIALCFVV